MMLRKTYTRDPRAWDMASRETMSYDVYNPYRGYARKPSKMKKFLYFVGWVCVIVILAWALKR